MKKSTRKIFIHIFVWSAIVLLLLSGIAPYIL